MSKKSMWSISFSTPVLVLIPVAVGINYVGKLFAQLLKLPLWLDSIGTVIASMLSGPIVGSISGAINNIIYGLTMDPISFVYALTSVAIGLTVGIMAYKGRINNLWRAVVVGLVVALVAAVVSTPLNVIFWGGQTGNVWGDALYAYLIAHGVPVWLSSFLDELVVDLPDKVATVIIAFLIFASLPKRLVQMYEGEEALEKLD
ncbi:ECF transporter S component [Coprothermobacter proteolyticus]|nr:ECF transporter S component [Coprothermobacter proteolyticus]MBK6586047.1 ECF transporter S component [Coprothermobacter sp.]ACI17201.2 membrane protein [Coprothermobacter proteolyticus DSM 5265]MBP8983555.1 ECF transporter S component [Coprothermobacter sp.]NLT84047.1 ECF transporter S component [Coprothermobacter proteolyticus]HOP45646.1 ECF transporter S component [Coprothermobacter proteolyticus]